MLDICARLALQKLVSLFGAAPKCPRFSVNNVIDAYLVSQLKISSSSLLFSKENMKMSPEIQRFAARKLFGARFCFRSHSKLMLKHQLRPNWTVRRPASPRNIYFVIKYEMRNVICGSVRAVYRMCTRNVGKHFAGDKRQSRFTTRATEGESKREREKEKTHGQTTTVVKLVLGN